MGLIILSIAFGYKEGDIHGWIVLGTGLIIAAILP